MIELLAEVLLARCGRRPRFRRASSLAPEARSSRPRALRGGASSRIAGYLRGFGRRNVRGAVIREDVLVHRDLGGQQGRVGEGKIPLVADLGAAVADIAAIPPDRVQQHAGIQRRDHVPGLPDQEPLVVVFHFQVGVPEQDRGFVLGREQGVLKIALEPPAGLGWRAKPADCSVRLSRIPAACSARR